MSPSEAEAPAESPHPKGTAAWLTVGSEGYGVLRAITTLAIEMSRRGWNTPIICFREGAVTEAARRLGFTVKVLDVGFPGGFEGGMLRKLPQLLASARIGRRAVKPIADILRTERASALRVVTPSLVGIAGRAAKMAGVFCCWEMPNVISSRYPFDLNRRIYQRLCRSYDISVLANSRFTAETIEGRGLRPEVRYPPTDHTVFDPARVTHVSRQSLEIPAGAEVLGMVARLVKDKGQHILIQAFGLLASTYPSAHLLLIGGQLDSDYGRSLMPLAQSLGIADRVHMTGQVHDTERYYSAIDVVISILDAPEAFGLSVVEAMMMQKPVLVRALGGPAETVLDGVTGWHIQGISPSDVAAGIRRAMEQKSAWTRMGQDGRERSVRHFSAVAAADDYEAILSRAQREPRTAG